MRANQRGLSLIELMISMVLGLLILGMTVSVFMGTSRTARTQDAASRLDDSGRFALDSVLRVVRLAGYSNWGGIAGGPRGYQAGTDPVLAGADGADVTTGFSDSLTMRYYGSGTAVGAADGSVVDCLGNPVPEGATFADRVVNTFSVRLTAGVRELTCDNGSGPVALVSGIDSFQVLYGLDLAGADRVPELWASATDVGVNWDQVVAVRVSLMVAGDANSRGINADSANYSLFDSFYNNAADQGTTYSASAQSADARARLRKVFTGTVFLRNRTSVSDV